MKEVAARMIAVYADIARDQGLDVPTLLRGLPLDPTDLRTRVSWGATLTFFQRMRDALGGDSAMEDAFVRFEPTSPDLIALTSRIVSPMGLCRFINTVLVKGNFTNMQVDFIEREGLRYEYRTRLAPGYVSDLAIVRGTVGFLRGQPRLLGLAEAQVSWQGVPEDFTCFVTLPPARHVGDRLRRLGEAAKARAGVYLGALLADRTNHRRDEQRLARLLAKLGLAAREDSTSEQLARIAVDLFREELGHAFSFLWSLAPSGRRLLASHGVRRDDCVVLPLDLGGETIALLETDPVDGRETLSTIAPLLALALRQRLEQEQAPKGQGDFPAEWKLTKRQREVTELVVQGHRNPFVAASLGCVVGTVEDHLTAIYEKAGVDGRQPLTTKVIAHRRGRTRA